MSFAPFPIHHHFYGWDSNHQFDGWCQWHCYTHISILSFCLQYPLVVDRGWWQQPSNSNYAQPLFLYPNQKRRSGIASRHNFFMCLFLTLVEYGSKVWNLAVHLTKCCCNWKYLYWDYAVIIRTVPVPSDVILQYITSLFCFNPHKILLQFNSSSSQAISAQGRQLMHPHESPIACRQFAPAAAPIRRLAKFHEKSSAATELNEMVSEMLKPL